jgi:hypothetical protein
MSEAARPGTTLAPPGILAETDDIRHAVRKLRWFADSFARQLQVRDDVTYEIDHRRLADAFVDWLKGFEARKPLAAGRERDFTRYASGLMLRALIRHDPVRVTRLPVGADPDDPAYFWPEGYAYVAYCLNVRAAVMRQEFDEAIRLHPDLRDIRTWQTFRENVAEDVSRAIAFLDHFAGATPDWSTPEIFSAVRAIALAREAAPTGLPLDEEVLRRIGGP